MKKEMSFGTRCVHAGEGPSPEYHAHSTPIYQTSTFVFNSSEEAAAMLDASTPPTASTAGIRHNTYKAINTLHSGKPKDVYVGHNDSGGVSRFFYVAKVSRNERGEGNDHPTVKPITLMRYLVRLATPPGGIVLDPFAGSGTTGIACLLEGFNPILIEKDPHSCEIAERRIKEAQK